MTEIDKSIINEVEDEIKPKTWKGTLWNITKTLLKFAVTSVLLYFVFRHVPFKDVKYRLLHANYWWMFAALICFFLSMIVSAWRLMSFFNSINLRLDPKFNFRLYLLGLFYNFLLPGGIGGDGYKIWLLNKNYKLPGKKVFWAIMFDRLSGLWAIGLITVVLIFLIPQIDIHIGIPLGIFAVASAIYYFVAYKFFREYTRYFFAGHAKAVVVQGFQVLAIVFILLGQDFHDKFSPYLLSFLISALATIIPISVGGAGIRETVFTQLTKVFPMDKTLAVFLPGSFYIISLLVALLGIYYVIRPSRLEEGLPKGQSVVDDEDTEQAKTV
ncbi:flippase-like domain-containing protein [Mucilaginibacter corticis]|uniref:Flippase-like domain-containing protein n=1 Tax=Mucilaginibacter corticis TaxID=2597670 RepID=A0A556MXK9_9SPHI|nr:lysylphosphatidylglycerol synthase transmembrane domain-containing protein [Mucilaginibacter corticis]TSJ44553.1 flippase-like domain-containing protein [Mucilaginibacter corticis]